MANTGDLYREIGVLKAAASERTAYYARVMGEGRQRIAELEAALVEETAWSEYNAETQGIRQDPPYQDVAARYEQAAREQLRQTGKL